MSKSKAKCLVGLFGVILALVLAFSMSAKAEDNSDNSYVIIPAAVSSDDLQSFLGNTDLSSGSLPVINPYTGELATPAAPAPQTGWKAWWAKNYQRVYDIGMGAGTILIIFMFIKAAQLRMAAKKPSSRTTNGVSNIKSKTAPRV